MSKTTKDLPAQLSLRFERVLVVGDSHANHRWWEGVITPMAKELNVDAIVQVGDFGWWPDKGQFRRTVRGGAVPTWFLDGNHEHHPDLAEHVTRARDRENIGDPLTPVPLTENLGYLPRGSQFNIGTLRVSCVGGAHSIDRALRKLGVSYFHNETLSDKDIELAAGVGQADVLLCHDAPAGWIVPGLLSERDLPKAWRGERLECEKHRDRLRQVYMALRPRHIVHGHYHSAYRLEVAEPWGTVAVDGLSCDGNGRKGVAVVLTDNFGVPTVERVV